MADVVLGAVGKVCTGFSKPYVAQYSAVDGTVSYTNGMVLARGVQVNVSPTSSSANTFYADNQAAESAPTRFTGGTVTLTVDGLLVEAERFIMGLPASDESGWAGYGDSAKAPYVGIGYIARYMSGGVESFVPTVLAKAKFDIPASDFATQQEEIDWQTQELTANLFRGEDTDHTWKWLGKDYATEAEAESALKTKLGITTTAA